MSMIKNPLNLNVYLILMISNKMATIFKIDATEDLNERCKYQCHFCGSCVHWIHNKCNGMKGLQGHNVSLP